MIVPLSFGDLREGQQCLLRAWRSRHEGEPASGADDPLAGVRALARRLFPGAPDARAGASSHAEAVANTQALIAAGTPCVLDATFDASGLRVIVEALDRTPRGTWLAVLARGNVRASWSLADRAAFTLHVLRSAGLRVAAVQALLIDPTFMRPDGQIDPAAFFVRRSVSFPARRRLARVAADAARVQAALDAPQPPEQAPGAHCRDGRDGCPHLSRCTSALPDDWTGWFPRKDAPPVRAWLEQGYLRMADVPADRQLPRGAEHARLASLGGGAHVSGGLADALAPAGPPAFYLDFECIAPSVPVYPGTRPYQAVPFLWSLHHDDGQGGLRHVDDLAPLKRVAPWRRMAEGLIAALGSGPTPIVVYSRYEEERLRELAAVLPELEAPLLEIVGRLVDLLEVVRAHVYDLRFRGSFSIKQVAPVLAPEVGYDDLSIRDGLTASDAYARLIGTADAGSLDVAKTLTDLRTYCARDTLALVALHRALRGLAATPPLRRASPGADV